MFQILTVIQMVAFMLRDRHGNSSKFQQASTPRHQKEARPAEKVQNYSLARQAGLRVPVHTLGLKRVS